MSGKDVTFEVNGQPAHGYLALPPQKDAPGVIVMHAWWGLNSIFKNLCDKLAAEGFAAFAPDLNSGRVAKTIEEAQQVMSELEGERKYRVAVAAPDFLWSQPQVKKEPLALIGFSMGVAWSLVLTGERPKDVSKIVMFYGAGEADYTHMKANVLGHFAEVDEWEEEKYIRAMENDMKAVGMKVDFHVYPNTNHWFFEEDRPQFNKEASALAWSRTLEFLKS